MLREIDQFFLNQPEPTKSCLLFLREFITGFDEHITEAWKYKMPFYCYRGKMFCYLWVDKKTGQPYIGIVEGRKLEHPLLLQDKRARMKVLQLDAHVDLPMETINSILKMALALYRK